MKDALNLRSKSGIHRLVSGLEERGFISRLPHRARALEVTRLPEESAVADRERGRFSPTVIRGDFAGALPGTPVAPDIAAVDLPLYGRIAAGTPIEALRDQNSSVAVPGSLVGARRALCARSRRRQHDRGRDPRWRYRHHPALRHRRKRRHRRGADRQLEVTLKRLRRRGASIALEPANKAYETRIFGPDRVKVQGRLVGLLRRY